MPLTRTKDSLLGDLLKIILAVILPPLGVFLEVGFGKHFWINIILTLLGFIPGIIHAVYVIASR
ncbi:YqaE/Pmp3 family membrane protein [Saccharospirillum sp.]|uniref:YqaE/Pmp3 family membrane protein n=1 Tax=Saccharospirillum sp. TaxID=2033801 RepID=UPI0034A031A9